MKALTFKSILQHVWYACAVVPSAFMALLMLDGYLSGKVPGLDCSIWVGACLSMSVYFIAVGPSLFSSSPSFGVEPDEGQK